MEKIRIRDPGWKKVGSGIRKNISDQQHCLAGLCQIRWSPPSLTLILYSKCPHLGKFQNQSLFYLVSGFHPAITHSKI
jgi:hypothetical protein